MNTIIQEPMQAKGIYTFTRAFLEKPEHFALSAEINEARKNGGDFMTLVRKLNSICRTEIVTYHNIVPTVGRGNIANNMTDSTPTNSLLINKFAVGTGTSTPANGDTTLQTETYRNDVASRTNAANIAYVTGFLNATESSGTYREVGLFAGGTGSANTGVLMSRVSVNITKSLTETLTVDWTFTIT